MLEGGVVLKLASDRGAATGSSFEEQMVAALVYDVGKRPEQVAANCAASDLRPLNDRTMEAVEAVYRQKIAPLVHQRW